MAQNDLKKTRISQWRILPVQGGILHWWKSEGGSSTAYTTRCSPHPDVRERRGHVENVPRFSIGGKGRGLVE